MNRVLPRLTLQHLLLLTGFTSAAVLGGALIGQYFFDLYPCHLCIFQRWPHAIVAVIAFAGAAALKSDKQRAPLLVVCCLILLIGMSIASYHAGVEVGIFKGPDGCSADLNSNASLEDLRAQISSAALVSCTQAMAYIFGLSMAAWNALLSLALVIFIFIQLRKRIT